jgi:hypothetical protein
MTYAAGAFDEIVQSAYNRYLFGCRSCFPAFESFAEIRSGAGETADGYLIDRGFSQRFILERHSSNIFSPG